MKPYNIGKQQQTATNSQSAQRRRVALLDSTPPTLEHVPPRHDPSVVGDNLAGRKWETTGRCAACNVHSCEADAQAARPSAGHAGYPHLRAGNPTVRTDVKVHVHTVEMSHGGSNYIDAANVAMSTICHSRKSNLDELSVQTVPTKLTLGIAKVVVKTE